MADSDVADDPRAMPQLALGFMTSKAIYAVTKLGIADYLGEEARTAEDIAEAVGADAHAVGRFLRYLASVGLFVEEGGRFALTPLGSTMRRDAPVSFRAMILMANSDTYLGWAQAEHTLRTGEPAFAKVFGGDFFQWLDRNPDAAQTFHAAMITPPNELATIVAQLDLADARHVIDVGGGNGHFLSAILAAYPPLQATLVDLAEAIEAAKAEQGGPLPNTALVVGDFFRAVPGGGDVYILQKILHDWNDEDCARILRTIRSAVEPGTRLAIVDVIVRPGQTGALLADMWMYVQSGGRERTAEEFEMLLANTGFRMTVARDTGARLGIVDAVAV
ncbi:MAG: dependent methyltransferase [Sphingomonas bacterium]|nr:dependent methyltransferase [Sphingomonas bacterium]